MQRHVVRITMPGDEENKCTSLTLQLRRLVISLYSFECDALPVLFVNEATFFLYTLESL